MIIHKSPGAGDPWLGSLFWPGAPGKQPARSLGKEAPLSLKESITALQRTLAARDPYTGQHSIRVAALAASFAQYLGLASEDLRSLGNAVNLHDLGKVGISDAILLKQGPLTPQERQIINTHPVIGVKIVEPLNLSPREKEIILLHHERWDGNGYPLGLAGEDIPFLCRLTALADVYDALVTDRPYRRQFTVSEALKEIEAHAGRQFDPRLAKEFIGFIAATEAKAVATAAPPNPA
uniref:HD-GYP domain-containing protein n=1 Tax=Desulfobacca acetoxidans TaxID=60893 RepID=A0A7C3SIS7_9BACT